MTAAAERRLYLVPPLSEITQVDTVTAVELAHARAIADIAAWLDQRHHLEMVVTVVDGVHGTEIQGDPQSTDHESFRVRAQALVIGPQPVWKSTRWRGRDHDRTLRDTAESREYLREEFLYDPSAHRSAEAEAVQLLVRKIVGK
ncbi:hypothetical protein SEA_KIKO_45 [Gordonia phage Kiko]|uniref:hypothetical protein n=1 Tax=Gordonia rubripertincta TaxID=36822 RepID=UPI000FDF6CEA|nr:hypothetical protein [Gordonia rubripertincta]AZV00769.1 hypothetical protein SEA_KIKO_45 [Gordonia phage Kiko]QMU22532.1 hypothetical protein H3V45_08715 [Gordonia rubripertincta]